MIFDKGFVNDFFFFYAQVSITKARDGFMPFLM